jgi:hypothetical protein
VRRIEEVIGAGDEKAVQRGVGDDVCGDESDAREGDHTEDESSAQREPL